MVEQNIKCNINVFIKSYELAKILDISDNQILRDIKEEIVNVSKSSIELPENIFIDRIETDEKGYKRNIYLISVDGILFLLPRYGNTNYVLRHRLTMLYKKMKSIHILN